MSENRCPSYVESMVSLFRRRNFNLFWLIWDFHWGLMETRSACFHWKKMCSQNRRFDEVWCFPWLSYFSENRCPSHAESMVLGDEGCFFEAFSPLRAASWIQLFSLEFYLGADFVFFTYIFVFFFSTTRDVSFSTAKHCSCLRTRHCVCSKICTFA